MKKNRKNTTVIKISVRFICIFLISGTFGFQSVAQQKIFVHSKILETDRSISVYLPAGYDSSKTYPVIYVLDGERIGALVASTNDYLVTCERTIPAIVVGIHQDTLRWTDCGYSAKTGEWSEQGKKFRVFLKEELKTYIRDRYHTSVYSVLIGHSFTASYAYLMALNDPESFQSYLALSPYLPESLQQKAVKYLQDKSLVFSLITITSSNDLSGHKSSIHKFREKLKKIGFSSEQVAFENLGQKTHLTLVPQGIEESLSFSFRNAQPLNLHFQYSSKMPVMDLEKLEIYYQKMNKTYGIASDICQEDFEFALNSLVYHHEWDKLKTLSEFTIQKNPFFYAGYYGLGAFYENKKQFGAALESYQKGFEQLGEDIANKADFYKDIERVRKKTPQD